MSQRDLLNAALEYASAGYPVFPLSGKQPAISGGFKSATTDLDTVQRWWAETYSGCNIGIPTGPASGFWCLDVDRKQAGVNGFNSLESLIAANGDLPLTAIQTTGSGGMHVLFRWTEHEIKNSASQI